MVNTPFFYIFGLWKMMPTRVLTKSIVVASLTKVTVELLLLPVTLTGSHAALTSDVSVEAHI
jgi:hypothetical protein